MHICTHRVSCERKLLLGLRRQNHDFVLPNPPHRQVSSRVYSAGDLQSNMKFLFAILSCGERGLIIIP